MISKFPQSADIGVLCVSTSVTKSFCFSQLLSCRGRDGRFLVTPTKLGKSTLDANFCTCADENFCTRCDSTFPFVVSMVVVRMISLKTGFLSFGKVLVRLLNSSVLRTLAPYRSCSKGLMQ